MAKVVKILLLLLILAGGGLGGYAWFKGQKSEQPAYTTVDVTRGDITEKAVAVGQIQPRHKFDIKSKISGIVRKTPAEVGDQVETGDPLLEISPDPTPAELLEAERQIEAAQSAFNRARSDLDRSQELMDKGLESQDTLDIKKESFEQSHIELKAAKDRLQLIQTGRISGRGTKMETIIRAPAAGILLERLVNPGDSVVPLTSYQEGTKLATIADMSDLIFLGTVDEIDVGKLEIGLPVRLKIGALPDEAVTGILSRIAPQAIEKDNAKLFEVEIELDPHDGVLLRAGYSANADIIIREKQDILLVPERLVSFEEEGAKAFVELPGATPEAEPQKVPVKAGLSDGLNVEVMTGLKEGDKVVQRPPRQIEG